MASDKTCEISTGPDLKRTKKRANLRDVAREAGVSVATVSRVLNDAPAVRVGTRSKVEAAIDALNFVPSAAARAINSGRTRIVGALIPTLDHAIYSRFLDALEQGLAAHDLSLVVATTNEDSELELARARGLLNLGVEGFIVSGVTHDPEFEALIKRRELPTVVTSFYAPDYHLPTVGYDNISVGQSALAHLLDRGHRNIVILHGPAATNDRTRARMRGVEAAAPAKLRFIEAELRHDAVEAAFTEAMSSHPPTAILCLSDVLAQGVLFACQNRGVNVPNDLAVMGVDDLPSSAHVSPALSTVHLPVRRMGRMAANALAMWVEHGKRPESVCVPIEPIVRAST